MQLKKKGKIQEAPLHHTSCLLVQAPAHHYDNACTLAEIITVSTHHHHHHNNVAFIKRKSVGSGCRGIAVLVLCQQKLFLQCMELLNAVGTSV